MRTRPRAGKNTAIERRMGNAAARVKLDLFDTLLGTFTRSTEASYFTGAPNTGTSAFLAWAPVNTRRIENRGDGLGNMLLLEGTRVNSALTSEQLLGGSWGGNIDPPSFNSTKMAPDGGLDADIYVNTVGDAICYQQVIAGAGSNYSVSASLSSWGYSTGSNDGGGICTRRMNFGSALYVPAFQNIPIATWTRLDFKAAGGSGSLGGYVYTPQTNGTASWWGAQVELNATFPTSYIRTTTATATRGTDVLTYPVGQYPASFLTRGFRFVHAPDFSSANIAVTNTEYRMVAIDSTNYVRIREDNTGTVRVEFYFGGFAVTRTVTFSRGQPLTITCEPNAGRLTVAGATTGDGSVTTTPAVWPTATLQVGQFSSVVPVYGRFGQFIEAV